VSDHGRACPGWVYKDELELTAVDPERVKADRFKAFPQVNASEIVEDLTAALAEFEAVDRAGGSI